MNEFVCVIEWRGGWLWVRWSLVFLNIVFWGWMWGELFFGLVVIERIFGGGLGWIGKG